ncbi:caspase-1-like [Schistocerca americana]|uniref:caspase-1-like n=1 Tax=Schistocerca americana TaxID=7009 RepID=UPI001F4FF908|nr:caspase-1-like [Schistocerca americana]
MSDSLITHADSFVGTGEEATSVQLSKPFSREETKMEYRHAGRSDVCKEADITAPMTNPQQYRRDNIKYAHYGIQLQARGFTPSIRPTAGPCEVLDAGVSSEEYFMDHQQRGVALIFSHKNFDARQHPDGDYQPTAREGTDADRDALRLTFVMLGFEVLCFNDRSHEEITSELRHVAEQDHDSRDCVAVAVLSHCGRDGQLSARDREYHVSELWQPFAPRRCPSLDGKPKLFFIQASRGRGLDLGVNISNIITDAPDAGHGSYADVLVSYSAFEGVTAAGETQNASRFVQTLHDELVAHRRGKDLVSLLTDVNRTVAQQVRLRTDWEHLLHGRLLQPCFTSTLTRRVYFR